MAGTGREVVRQLGAPSLRAASLVRSVFGQRRGSERRLSEMASWLLLAPLLTLFAAVFLFPMLDMLDRSLFDPELTTRHYEELFSRDLYLRVVWRTIKISVTVAAATLVLGYPVAYLMARVKGWQAALVAACVFIPLWSSTLVRSYTWTALLARNGIVNSSLLELGIVSEPLRLLYTEGAVIVAMTHVMLPFMVLPLYASLRSIKDDLPRAASVLGASGFATFRYIIWPLSLPGVSAGLVMVFLVSLGFFITPALVGGAQTMMVATLVAHELTTGFNWGLASAIAAVLLLIALAVTFSFNRILKLDQLSSQEGR